MIMINVNFLFLHYVIHFIVHVEIDFTSDLSFSISHLKGIQEEEFWERYHLQKKLLYHLFEVNECSTTGGDDLKEK